MRAGPINDLLGAPARGAPEPTVGMGATILMACDRHAATIVEVLRHKRSGAVKGVVVQQDEAKPLHKDVFKERQQYEYTPNPDAARQVYTLRKNGRYVLAEDRAHNGQCLRIGVRDEYYDPHF